MSNEKTTGDALREFIDHAARGAAASIDAEARATVPRDTGAFREHFSVRKVGYTMPVSIERALDEGLITEGEARARGWTLPPPVPRLRALRWRLQSWWYDHKPHMHLGPCDHGDCA